MEEITIYKAKNGQRFDNALDCLNYEKALNKSERESIQHKFVKLKKIEVVPSDFGISGFNEGWWNSFLFIPELIDEIDTINEYVKTQFDDTNNLFGYEVLGKAVVICFDYSDNDVEYFMVEDHLKNIIDYVQDTINNFNTLTENNEDK